MRHILVLVMLVLMSGACSPGDEADLDATGSDVAAGAATTDARTGEALYQANCARCHGADLMGTRQGPPFIDDVYVPSHHADESFLLAVRNGVRAHHWSFGDMPPIPGLSNEDITAIVSYVREQQRAAGLIE